ncbi:MAG TPA: polyprenol monophosphomannose synthase [Candidatus Xenobia bacterium]
MTIPDVSIVIPTYNEKDALPALTEKVFAALEKSQVSGELVVVDDNSPDGTGQVAEGLRGRFQIKVVHRAGKLGLASAVIEGFSAATSPIVGIMDADGSHDAAILPQMVEVVRSGRAELAVGSRYVPGGGTADWPWFRLFGSRVASAIGHLVSPIRDATSGYCVFQRAILDGVQLNPVGFKILLEIAVRGKFTKFVEVPYVFRDREAGKSKFGKKEIINYFKHIWILWPYRKQGLAKRPA